MVQKDFFDSIDPALTQPVFGRFWGLKIAEISAVNKLSKKLVNHWTYDALKWLVGEEGLEPSKS